MTGGRVVHGLSGGHDGDVLLAVLSTIGDGDGSGGVFKVGSGQVAVEGGPIVVRIPRSSGLREQGGETRDDGGNQKSQSKDRAWRC